MPYRSSLCLMASMVREGRISPTELVESHLQQIAARNPSINAFTAVLKHQARCEARERERQLSRGDAPGLLHGVPVTVKDCFDVAGLPTLAGSRLRLAHRAAEDSGVVARLRSAGAVILGKTNCPEFLSSYETDNLVTGRTNNPWNLARTPGGSSGGEAAAIASYCSAGGIGSDGGGSIRMPAHFCGIAGLKPTPGRISAAGHFPACNHPWGMLTVAGPMARTAEELRLLFAALAGYDSQDVFSAPVPVRVPQIAGVRVGVMEAFYDVPVHPAIRDAVVKAAGILSDLRIPAEPFRPQGIERAPNLWWFFFGVLPAPAVRKMVQGHEAELHRLTIESMRATEGQPPPTQEEILTSFAKRDRMRAALLRQMEQYPVLLLPPCGAEAFPHGARRWPMGGGADLGVFQAMMPSTVWNVLGLPAVTIPFEFSETGMPVGVQLVARPWEEELLLEIAVMIEEARGPFPAPPARD